ncbi:MAG TPA: DtxR family transcriptional regulator [Clostridiales bacterium]|nr:DtxR family transcriptional regulator [Clostridiales bacterium]
MYESGEMYLETILVLKNRIGNVRSIDIARELDFSKPSVSRAVGILKDDGYIEVDGDGFIELTHDGKIKAESIYERHERLTAFLSEVIGISKETAETDACKIEHIISDETFNSIKKYMKEHENKSNK